MYAYKGKFEMNGDALQLPEPVSPSSSYENLGSVYSSDDEGDSPVSDPMLDA